jgi:hypothetical protein
VPSTGRCRPRSFAAKSTEETEVPTQVEQLTDKITRRLVRGCGENRIPYTVEDIGILAGWSAEVAVHEFQRRGPDAASAPAVTAPAPAEPPGEGAAPPGAPQAATGATEGVGGRR